jgi:hypothetical protein
MPPVTDGEAWQTNTLEDEDENDFPLPQLTHLRVRGTVPTANPLQAVHDSYRTTYPDLYLSLSRRDSHWWPLVL